MTDTNSIYNQLGVSDKVLCFGQEVLAGLSDQFRHIDQVAEFNQAKVIAAMQKNRVNATHFNLSTGYGYDDEGRDNLERVYADCFGTEAALVRPQITCGTHALALALGANLLPSDELLSPVGGPYDTLEEVIGIRPSPCSLKEYGVSYRQVDLLPGGGFDYDGIRAAINEKTKLITIQRSKGYATRPSYSVEEIGKLIAFCKECKPDVLCMVDNCYGEFVETQEPTNVGADMVVGSLIKNLGGGLAPTGGYVCGRKECIERCAYRLSAPGLGREVGANLGLLTSFYQGLFLAPTVVSSAVRGAVFAAGCYEMLGFGVVPGSGETRRDIIQAVELGSREPVFDIVVSAAKKSTFSRLSQNETAKECYKLGFFDPANADAALAALEMMDFEGIEKVRQRVRQNGTLAQQLAQMQAQMAQLTGLLEVQKKSKAPKLSGPAQELSTAAMARAMKTQKGEMR